MTNFQEYGVTGTWVKSYDVYGRLSETHAIATTDAAREEYQRRIGNDNTTYAQWGAKTIEGTIVLGEYRK